jgi:hypothetical protein
MSDPYSAAERAAYTAFGTMADRATIERLRDALAAYRTTLCAAGILRDDSIITPADIELAARLLAREASRGGFPRYGGDGWRMLLRSPGDIDLAYKKASVGVPPVDEATIRDLAWARRVLRAATGTPHDEDQQGGGQR